METAGSAVGIASLGIQICQGLISYYHDWRSYHDDIFAAYDKVSNLERTFALLKEILGQDSLDGEQKSQVRDSLLSCKDSIYGLEKRCAKLKAFGQPSNLREKAAAVTKRTLYPFKASTLAKVSEAVNDVLDQLALAVQTLHLGLSSSSHGQLVNVASRVDDVAAQLSELKQDLSGWRHDDQYIKIMSWVDAPDQTPYHTTACQKHEPGTGQWLLESDTYKTWKTSSSAHLWLHGKAGCGKTVLCSTLVEDLKAHCASVADSALAYFYFSFSDVNSQSYRKLLASLVHQLCSDQPSYAKLKEAFDRTQQASVHLLETVLDFQIEQHGNVTLVLDALDELPEGDDRLLVLDKLLALSSHGANAKVLVTSRGSADIEGTMSGMKALVLPLSVQEVNADIGRYIVDDFNQTPSLLRWSSKMQDRARETLEQRADGMFRWVFCQLQELKRLRSTREKSIEAALQSLPVGLNATYERMLKRIDQHDRQEAVTMLRWLSYAKHTLTLGELQEARLINPDLEGSVAWDDPGSIDDIVEILGDLIRVEDPFDVSTRQVRREGTGERDRMAYDSYREYVRIHGEISDNGTSHSGNFSAGNRTDLYTTWWTNEGQKFARVQLAHFSVKEYLVSAHARQDLFQDLPFHETMAQRCLAQSCLTYLLEYSKSNENSWCAQDNLKYLLLGCATKSWVSHVDGYDEHVLPHEVLLLRDKKARSDWLHAKYGTYKCSDEALYCASELGHKGCVKALLDLGEPVDAVGGLHLSQSALQVASEKGHRAVVQVLLDAGADVDWTGVSHYEFQTTALYEATIEGQEEIVDILLGAGASIRPVMQPQYPGFGTTSLLAAAAWGHTSIVKRLIAAGSDVNALGFLRSGGSTAVTSVLHAACTSGNDATVGVLINAGADVDGIGRLAINDSIALPDTAAGVKPTSTALLAAASIGYTKIFESLIDAGADLDVVGCMQLASPVSIAPTIRIRPVDQRPRKSVCTLVVSALHAASINGHIDTVRALLKGGAAVDVLGYLPEGETFTALCAACEAEHAEIVIEILEAGASTLDKYPDHRNPLISAILAGLVDVIVLLIKAGIDVNSRASSASALGVAAANGQALIVKALLRAGAHTGFDDYHGHTALMIASADGHMDVVEALLDEAGGQPSLMPGFEEAIDLAVKEGNADIEQMLLDQLMISQLQ